MNETIQFWKMINLAIMATVAALSAGLTFRILVKRMGNDYVQQKIKEMQANPVAFSIFLSTGFFSIFHLYATIFTRF